MPAMLPMQAVFFPIPRNDDVVSHPVNEWNGGHDRDFSEPSVWVIS